MEDLTRAVVAGDPAALARAISLVEEGAPRGEKILAEVFRDTGRAAVIGVTGPPGAGKSSLVNRLVSQYRSRGGRVGVVAVDPSSAFSGGAILGDRIRMQQHTLDPEPHAHHRRHVADREDRAEPAPIAQRVELQQLRRM